MKKIILIISLITIILLPQIESASQNTFNNLENNIEIQRNNDEYFIEETYIIKGKLNNTYQIIEIWVSENAEDIKAYFVGNEIELTPNGNNYYSINISSFNIIQNNSISIEIKYYFNNEINEFKKKIIYDTNQINIIFNDETIFQGEKISNQSYILLPLYLPTEAPINTYMFIGIFLIVLLALITTYYILKRQKSSKLSNINGESKELLSTKKSLLMIILKQIEKDHRTKNISDDTYHKLRDFYKQQAVESMKKLEDIESEII
jgi:hypothetical protein